MTLAALVRAGLLVAWTLSGLALVRARRWRLGGLVLAAAALGGALVLCGGILQRDPTGPLASAAALVRPLAAGLLPAVALDLIASLPDGQLVSRPRRVVVAVGYAAGVGLGLALWAERPALPPWPVVVAGILAVAAGVPLSHRRFVAASGTARQRMEWIGLAAVLVAEAALVVTAFRVLAGWPRQVPEVVGAVSVVIPLGLAAGTSPRLLGRVDRLLAHTVSLAGLSGLVVAVYLLVVLGLGRVPSERERALLLLSMVAAAVCALLYHPARQRLTEAANRMVYGERSPPEEALRTFGTRLSRAIPLDELLLQLAESLHKTMTLEAAEVWTGSEGLLERAASVPDLGPARLVLDQAEASVIARAGVSGPAWLAIWIPSLLEGREAAATRVAAVAHSGELLGLLVVARRVDEHFTEEDERVLAELARQVGLALHNVRLDSALQASLVELRRRAEELQASRARIVAAADAERRRIERNLHDGAQQRLVALAVKLRLARRLVDADPEQTRGMLDELREELKDAVEELRSLAHGIYPPLLMDQGLAAALGSAAQRATIPTRVEAGPIGRYPSEMEAAAYFCCLEALQNAMKHAGPQATAVVGVWEEAGALRFTVRDDGTGFDPAAGDGGTGFVNMRDRLGAIGGTLRVESSPGTGTSILGTLPLGR
jgi:signal transduction histidine kinase